MASYNNTTIKKMNYNGQKVKKWYHDGAKVFSAGNVVTYYFNPGDYAQEEVDSEASVLAPKTINYLNHFSGWTFVGWREDKTASSSVLSSKVMGDEPITLYAVYKQTLSLSFENNYASGGSTAPVYGTLYYNNGNTVKPTVYLPSCGYSYSGATFQRWGLGTPGTAVTLAENTSTRAWIKYNDLVPKENQYWPAGTLHGGTGNDNLFSIDGTKYSSIYIASCNMERGTIWIDNGYGRIWSPSDARYVRSPSALATYNLLFHAFSARYDGYNQKYYNGQDWSDGGATLTLNNISVSIPAITVHMYLNNHDEDYGGIIATGVKYIGRTLT